MGRKEDNGPPLIFRKIGQQRAKRLKIALGIVVVSGAKDTAEERKQPLPLRSLRGLKLRQRGMTANPLDCGTGDVRQPEETVQADAGVLQETVGEVNGKPAFKSANCDRRTLAKGGPDEANQPPAVPAAKLARVLRFDLRGSKALGEIGFGSEAVSPLGIDVTPPRAIAPTTGLASEIDVTSVAHTHQAPSMGVVGVEILGAPLLVKDELFEDEAAVLHALGEIANQSGHVPGNRYLGHDQSLRTKRRA